jgi:LacI family transcriptional regulator
MIQGIEKALQLTCCAYSVEFIDKERQERMDFPNHLSKNARYDGMIYIGRFQDSYVQALGSKVRSHVFYTGYAPSADCDSVWYNFNNCGYRQCEYLIRNGHRDIGFVGSHSDYINKEKVLGIVSAMEDYMVPIRNEFFLYSSENTGGQALELLLRNNRPTAVICQWDYTALRLIRTLHEAGIRVPDDVSVIGSGNTDMSALSIPALTTMDLNIDYACERAVELLLRRIEKPGKPFETLLVNGNFVERNSVKQLV